MPDPITNVRPDRVDLRDRLFLPSIAKAPPLNIHPFAGALVAPAVARQGETEACTGFALAWIIDFLHERAGRQSLTPVSPHMIYSMARRYDEFPGSQDDDTGSSLRGALKGWHRHGVCKSELWNVPTMPDQSVVGGQDWWFDATRRPLGGYYRVDKDSIVDLQLAIAEVGVVYVSALTHEGWRRGYRTPAERSKDFHIPFGKGSVFAGHAFAIVGYGEEGFLVLNSWGDDWGCGGLAFLSYTDWLKNGMDAWVTQLGVISEFREKIAEATSVVTSGDGGGLRVRLASDPTLRNHQMMPFIINVGNNGELSQTGGFRTNLGDLKAIFERHLPAARREFGLKPKERIDVAIYAHGGLTGEDGAAETFGEWFPALYEAKIMPIFLMWETEPLSTIRYRLEDFFKKSGVPAGNVGNLLEDVADAVIENTVAPIGTQFWNEMKQNARQITANSRGGLRQLFDIAIGNLGKKLGEVRIHLIGHSAGAIVHSHLVEYLAANASHLKTKGVDLGSLHLMAAAVRIDLFERTALPHLMTGAIRALRLYQLSSRLEEQDGTCRAILGYSRSLLYLVSRSFEGGRRVPLLGMEDFLTPAMERWGKIKSDVRVHTSECRDAESNSHGGFSSDEATRKSIIRQIQKMRKN